MPKVLRNEIPPILLAHRCGMARAPENSIEGMIRCYEDGARSLECDIAFTRDWQAVVWDAAQKEFSGRKTDVRRLTFAEAKQLVRKDTGRGLTTPEEIWRFLKNRPDAKIYFDIKYYGSVFGDYISDAFGALKIVSPCFVVAALREIVLPATQRGLLSQIGFVAFAGGMNILEAVKIAAPEISIDLMVVFPWENPASHAPYLDSVTIGWKKHNHWKLFPRSLRRIMRETRAAGLTLRCGLVNSPEEMRWAIEHGFDEIWTDDVAKAKERR